MNKILLIATVLAVAGGLATMAEADPGSVFTIYADSTLAGQSGYLMAIEETVDEGSPESQTLFVTAESGHVRVVATRPFGEQAWEILSAGTYIAPGPDDVVGSNWTTFPDDFGRPARSYLEAFETITTVAGTFDVARCVVRPDEALDEIAAIRYFADGVGLVAELFPGDDTDLMTSYDIVGGLGYFPLAVGNTWDYVSLSQGTPVGDTPTPGVVLHACSPNPFNPRTVIAFETATTGQASLRVFDAAGRLVRTLVDGQRPSGSHSVAWDGRDATGRMAAAGVYLYRLEAGGTVRSRAMTLVK